MRRRAFPPSLAHVAPDGAPVNLQSEFEQFTPNAFGAPAPILNGHPFDQGDCLFIDPRLASLPLRFVSPEELEPVAMPFE